MAYLTDFSYRQLIARIEIQNIDKIDSLFFTKNIFDNEYLFYFFNQFELQRLFKEKVILSGDKKFLLAYKEVPRRKDDLNYILEIKGKIKYHKDDKCLALKKGFKNFFMPEPIARLETDEPEKHLRLVAEIRQWFLINNYTVERYLNCELTDSLLTTKFNEYFPEKFNISRITISQAEVGQFKWYIERLATGNVQVETVFNYDAFIINIADLVIKRDYLCNGKPLQNLSRYDFLLNKTDEEIEKVILEKIQMGLLKIVQPIFLKNYGIENLRKFWFNHLELKQNAITSLVEYFKWTYNFKDSAFEEVFLENFNIEQCNLCH